MDLDRTAADSASSLAFRLEKFFEMKVLYFGDVFASPGREAVKIAMHKLMPEHQIDFVVVNGENMAHGNGILPEMAQEFFDLGVDVITTGNPGCLIQLGIGAKQHGLKAAVVHPIELLHGAYLTALGKHVSFQCP